MELYVVIDTKGNGRLVGVFDSQEKAQWFIKKYPAYYKLHTVGLNQINPEIIDWADSDEQRQSLKTYIAQQY